MADRGVADREAAATDLTAEQCALWLKSQRCLDGDQAARNAFLRTALWVQQLVVRRGKITRAAQLVGRISQIARENPEAALGSGGQEWSGAARARARAAASRATSRSPPPGLPPPAPVPFPGPPPPGPPPQAGLALLRPKMMPRPGPAAPARPPVASSVAHQSTTEGGAADRDVVLEWLHGYRQHRLQERLQERARASGCTTYYYCCCGYCCCGYCCCGYCCCAYCLLLPPLLLVLLLLLPLLQLLTTTAHCYCLLLLLTASAAYYCC